MRQSRLFLQTLREKPNDADVASHQLMQRAGLVRSVAAGIYSYLPLGYRVLSKVEQIVRQEMDAAGAQEVLLPAMQPGELWQLSGRYDLYGAELVRFQDRHDRQMVLGPTHEEVITKLVQQSVRSYRQLPVTLYQIGTKFRDEPRPRAGLLRGREFRMKDAYSFDADRASLELSYQAMFDAYCRIFERIGVDYRAVDADPGAIGGSGGSHEFMVLSSAGEDTVASCTACSYAANVEKAVAMSSSPVADVAKVARQCVHTPNTRTIEDLAALLAVAAAKIVKVIIYLADQQPVAVCLRGDHAVNEIKLKNLLGAAELELASPEQVFQITGKPVGFVPPDVDLPIIFDRDICSIHDGVMAAAQPQYHDVHVEPGRDFALSRVEDVRTVVPGDRCERCGSPLQFDRGIEVGHVFKLGDRYSKVFTARFADENGVEQTLLMGCYGIGTSRVVAAVVEQCHDNDGMIWPISVAPYHVHIVPVSVRDEAQVKAAEALYHRLFAAGVEVLLDDRDERPGVKFKDSDLIGLPVRVTVGNKISDGNVELKVRKTGEVQVLSLEQAFEYILGMVK